MRVVGERRTTCRQAQNLLQEELSGRLAAPEGERLTAHLGACRRCEARAARLRAAVGVLRQAPPPVPPEDLARRIRAAAHEALRPAPTLVTVPQRVWRPAPAWAAAAALAAVVLAVTLWTYSNSGPAPQGLSAPVVAQIPTTQPAAGVPELAVPAAVATDRRPPDSGERLVATVTRRARVARTAPAAVTNETPVRLAAVRRVTPPLPPAPVVAPSPPAFAAEVTRAPDSPTSAAPLGLPHPEPRVAVVPPRPRANRSGAFAEEVMGGLVAGVMLTSYLDGAPHGTRVRPAAAGSLAGGPQ